MADPEKPETPDAAGVGSSSGAAERDEHLESTSTWQRCDGRMYPYETMPGVDRAEWSLAERAVKRDGLVLYTYIPRDGDTVDPAMEAHNRETFAAWKGRKPAAPTVTAGGDDGNQPWITAAVREELARLRDAKPRTRNDTLNVVGLRLARLLPDQRAWLRGQLIDACEHNGEVAYKGLRSVEATIDSAYRKADLDGPANVPQRTARVTDVREQPSETPDGQGEDYSITLRPASDFRDAAPEWVWFYGGKGRLMRGTSVLFAGRPGAGKSTAARYFAAGLSRGTIEGCFHGTPVNVAYIAAEESVVYMVKPSLRAHNADMDRVMFPEVKLGGTVVKLLSLRDEQLLTERLLAQNVSAVIVDPIMSTISGRTDVYRSNETREHLEPWTRIAETINGLVVGIVHLRKQFGGDVMAAINASSAFGEVARGVLAFAQDQSDGDDSERVMSQEKNSAGSTDLALTYRIETVDVRTDDGETARPGRFVIGSPSTRRVADVLGANDTQDRLGPLALEVLEVVREHRQPVGPSQVASQVEGLDNDMAGKYLRRLAKQGLLVKTGRGLFDLPSNVKPKQ